MHGGGGNLRQRRGQRTRQLEAVVRAPAAVELATTTLGVNGSHRAAAPSGHGGGTRMRAQPHAVRPTACAAAVVEHAGMVAVRGHRDSGTPVGWRAQRAASLRREWRRRSGKE